MDLLSALLPSERLFSRWKRILSMKGNGQLQAI